MCQNFCTSARLEDPDMNNVAYNAERGKSVARMLECQAAQINLKNNELKDLKGRTSVSCVWCGGRVDASSLCALASILQVN